MTGEQEIFCDELNYAEKKLEDVRTMLANARSRNSSLRAIIEARNPSVAVIPHCSMTSPDEVVTSRELSVIGNQESDIRTDSFYGLA